MHEANGFISLKGINEIATKSFNIYFIDKSVGNHYQI